MRFIQIVISFTLILSVSCVSTQKYVRSQETINRLKSDSLSLEKRNRMLQNEVNYLGTKNATTEQALTQRLQEKEDSLNHKQQLLSDKELSILDMKARKAEEREAFAKLSAEIVKPFRTYASNEVITRTNCSQTVVEVSDRILFLPLTTKLDLTKAATLAALLADILTKQPDLKLIIVNHTDSVYLGKEKWEDNWSRGSFKANTVAKYLIKDYKIAPQRITPATQADYILLDKLNSGLGRMRTSFLFYSELLPCIHTGE